MIDRTITQHARRALRWMTNDLGFERKRPRRQWIGWAEDHDRRTPKRRRDVRRTSIVRDYQIDHPEHRSDLIERGLAGQHNRLMPHSARHFVCHIELVARAN